MQKNLLIIEDESSLAKQLKWALSKDYSIAIASSANQALSLLASSAYPVVTLDLGLPPFPDTPQEGLKLLEEIRSIAPHSKVIVITGNSEEEHAIKAIGLGASDFCAKPIDIKLLEIILSRTYRIFELEEANRNLEKQCGNNGSFCDMLGISPAMTKVFGLIRQVSVTDYAILITGESGTGKEKAALAVHALGRRSQKPLVTINCGAIPENLLESELFGHEKGAFTGAVARKIGRFECADGGTVFLDEIGDMPLALQLKLLRVLQEGTIERVGGNATIKLDVRVITATNVDLQDAVQRGAFRQDLFHRLNVIPLHLPPLRERPEDILMLAQHFLKKEAENSGKRTSFSFSRTGLAALTTYSWPGNVRELQNRIRRAIALSEGMIEPEHLGLEGHIISSKPSEIIRLQEARDRAEVGALRRAFAATGNNISQAAKLLGVSRPTIHDLIKKHSISVNNH